MTVVGDTAKITLLLFAFYYVMTMAVLAAYGETAISLLMLVGLLIPAAWLTYWHSKDPKPH